MIPPEGVKVPVCVCLASSLHEELSQQVGHAQQDQEAVEDGRRPAERPLPLQGDHVDQSREDEHEGQATCGSGEPAGGDREETSGQQGVKLRTEETFTHRLGHRLVSAVITNVRHQSPNVIRSDLSYQTGLSPENGK